MELTAGELRDCQLGTLDAIVEFCTLSDLRYYLAYGTLLGAVRHGGYIPWDDDVDLMMPRADYERFCATFNVDGSRHEVRSVGTSHAWPFPYAKVCDRRTVVTEAIDVDETMEYGVNVDIFPLDDHHPGRLRRTVQVSLARFLVTMHVLRLMTPRTGRARTKAAVLGLAKLLLRPIGPATLARAASRAATGTHVDSTRLGIFVGSYAWSVEREAFEGVAHLPFEQRHCAVPARYGDILTAMYGPHYLVPPPAEERQTHHRFVAAWT